MIDETKRMEAERYLRMAMDEAEIAGVARNRTAEEHDPSSHAELNVIRRVCRERGTLTLEGYRLYTNGAPCSMCATMILQTGIAELWYSAPPASDRTLPTIEEMIERTGATTPRVHQGLLEGEASAQLARHSR